MFLSPVAVSVTFCLLSPTIYMPPKRSNLSRNDKQAIKKSWGLARRLDRWRFDQAPTSYTGRYCFSIRPNKANRGFRSSIDTITNVRLWDSTTKTFQDLAVPQAYLIHIWWIQMHAHFWRDTDARMGVYLTWLMDQFAEEALEGCTNELMGPGWRSDVLDGIICRSFFHVVEDNIMTDFDIALRSARIARGDDDLQFHELGQDDFDQIYERWDAMDDRCREGVDFSCIPQRFFNLTLPSMPAWRSRIEQNHGLRWFMRRAIIRPTPWRPQSEIRYDDTSRQELYTYINLYETGDIFVDPRTPQFDLSPVESDSDSKYGSCESSVRTSSRLFPGSALTF